MAFVRLTTTPTTEAGLYTFIAELPELLECHRVTGNESFMTLVRAEATPEGEVHHALFCSEVQHRGEPVHRGKQAQRNARRTIRSKLRKIGIGTLKTTRTICRKYHNLALAHLR